MEMFRVRCSVLALLRMLRISESLAIHYDACTSRACELTVSKAHMPSKP